VHLLLTLQIAARALKKNKMRAGLTVLGIVIGIAAVIAMVSIGQSASAMVQDQFLSLGTNMIVVFPGSQVGGGVRRGAGSIVSLTPADAGAIAKECSGVLAVTAESRATGQVIYGNSNWYPDEIQGADTGFLTVRNWQLRSGGFFTERDVHAAAKVCVIGQTLVAKLFQTTNPIGKIVRLKNIPFQIIGVLEAKGASIVGQDQDNIVVVPYTTVKKRLSGSPFNNVDQILVSARSVNRMPEVEAEIRSLLHERHHIRPGDLDDFTVRNTSEIANALGAVTGIMTLLLAAIASVSLLVGGVGIMNIMLVSVTERTREIGIRMAVGARARDILRQFLIEAILLSSVGGLVGIALGIGASMGITAVINSITSGSRWPVVISVNAIVIALIFAAAVGVFFGYYPARKASRLDPIDALRYE
jgi:putative ABC transport system permease protein